MSESRGNRVSSARGPMKPAQMWGDVAFDLIDDGPRTPAEHMAVDQVLLEGLASGRRGPTLRFGEWGSGAVVIGSFQSVHNEVDIEAARCHGLAIVRRISGGGTMFIQPADTISYSLVVPGSLVAGMSFVESYAFLDAWVVETLQDLGIQCSYVPINDIASPHGKIAGAAQKRLTGGAVLHHTAMAYALDDATMRDVLSMGRQDADVKGVKSANKSVDPLVNQTALSRENIIAAMRERFIQEHPVTSSRLTDAEESDVSRLVKEKFANPDWTCRVP